MQAISIVDVSIFLVCVDTDQGSGRHIWLAHKRSVRTQTGEVQWHRITADRTIVHGQIVFRR